MGRKKTTARQILLALDRICKKDMGTFLYKMRTGRLLNDYDIMLELGCNIQPESLYEISNYIDKYKDSLDTESVAELKKKGWITPTSIKKAKNIMAFIKMKKGTHVKKGMR